MMTISIALKLILAMMLGAAPFVITFLTRRDEKNKKCGIGRLSRWLGAKMPAINNLCHAVKDFLRRLYDGMKRSDNFRRFFHYMIILCLLALLVVDGLASESAAEILQKAAVIEPHQHSTGTLDYNTCYTLLNGIRTSVFVTLVTQIAALIFFSYKYANKILTAIHHNRRAAVILFGAAVTVVVNTKFMLLSEAVLILLIAGRIYPDKVPTTAGPDGGLRIIRHKRRKLRIAA